MHGQNRIKSRIKFYVNPPSMDHTDTRGQTNELGHDEANGRFSRLCVPEKCKLFKRSNYCTE